MASKMLTNFYLEYGYTLERIEELSPEEWSDYTYGGDYLKTFYDFMMQDGTTYLNKWPNGGQFDTDSGFISIKDVVKFRLSKNKYKFE